MDKMKHTPGHWFVDNGPKSVDADYRLLEIHSHAGGKTGDGNVIATVHGDIFNHTVPLINEGKANARLIAAAPELLEALQDVLQRISNSEHWWIDSPDRGGFDVSK